MHYIDWSKSFDRETGTGAVYRPVTVEVEPHVHVELLGDSRTKFLVSQDGRSTFDGANGRPPLFAHIYEWLPNVPRKDVDSVVASAKMRLSIVHGVQPDDIIVRLS